MAGARRLAVLSLSLALAASAFTIAPAPLAAQQSGSDEESEIYVQDARSALARKDYGRAGALLDRALKVNPRRIDTYVLRATVYAARQEYAQGIAVLRRARALAPDNAYVLTALGAQLVLAHHADEGVPLLEEVVRRWPERYEAHAALAHHDERTGRFAEAIVEFEAYFRTRPAQLEHEDPTHQIDYANALLRAGKPAAARDLYQRILARDGKNVIARLGFAWSLAAIDCNRALPALRRLGDLAAKHPEVLLVQGRCELILGKGADAVASANEYTRRRPEEAGGWALLGEARVAAGDLKGAAQALHTALERAPRNPVYALGLARIERLQGTPRPAIERLRAAGAPPGYEDAWTRELAEALVADGKPAEAAKLLTPWVAAHASDVGAQTALGVALYDAGDTDGAVLHLEQALTIAPGAPEAARARPVLQVALASAGVAAFGRRDYSRAEAQLARAAQLGDDALILRDLGAVRLAVGDAPGAIAPLERAVQLEADSANGWHLLGRTYAAAGRGKPAEAALRKALALGGAAGAATADAPRAVDPGRTAFVRIDLAATLLAGGDAAEAVSVLEPVLGAAGKEGTAAAAKDPRVARARDAYLVAARAAATQWMRAGAFERAYRQLDEALARLPGDGGAATAELGLALRCDLALAATGAGLRDVALRRLRDLEKEKAVCPFAAPADRLAVPILIAWNEGSLVAFAEAALHRLDALRRSATGPARPLVVEATRVILLRAAAELYGAGNLARARAYVAKAHHDEDAAGPELAHDDAVLLLEDGQLDAAIAGLDAVAAVVPEALVNLGIAWERKGDQSRALDFFHRAQAAGVKFGPLRGWIAVKERLWGGAP